MVCIWFCMFSMVLELLVEEELVVVKPGFGINALLDALVVAVYINVEVLVKLDDAFEVAGLFFDGAVGDVKLFGYGDGVLLFVLFFVFVEGFDDFRLSDDLFLEFLHSEGVVFFEEGDGVVEDFSLVGFGDVFELGGHKFGDEAFAEVHHVFGVVEGVFALAAVEEVVDPVLGFQAFVGIVDDGDSIAVFSFGFEDEAPFVEFVEPEAEVAFNDEMVGFLVYFEEGVFGFGFEEADGVHLFIFKGALFEVYDVELTAFDFGVVALVIKMLGEIERLFHQGVGIIKDGVDTLEYLVGTEAVFVVKLEELVGFEGEEEIVFEHILHLFVHIEWLVGEAEGFVQVFVSDCVEGYCFDDGICEVHSEKVEW